MMSFDSLFFPRGVAVVGSMAPGKLGHILVKQLLEGGFTGSIYAVNPKSMGALGVPGFPSLAAVGEPVDLAVIASPAGSVAEVLDDCGRAGVGAAVVITSGFSEMGNQAGETAILAAARRNHIRVVGPNCAGIICTRHHLYPTLEVHPPEGGVALISQSGALGGVVLAWAAEQGMGISKFVSYGNGIDINPVDLLHYLKDDPETKVVALYIESIKEGRPFMEALEACSRVKPVVVIKAGRTGVGQRATASHTGSMAGSDAVYDAAIAQSGAIRVKTVEEMIDLCTGFLNLPPLEGNRVLIVTNSGGPGVLAADMAEEAGLKVAEVSPAMVEKLRQFLPPHCGFRNPIDLTVEGTEEGYRETLMAAMDDYDAALAMNIATPYLDSLSLARGVAAAASQSGKPLVVNFLPNQVVQNSVAYLKERGIPNFPSGERAVSALANMARYYQAGKQLRSQAGFSQTWQNLQQRLAGKTRPLPGSIPMLEPEAMDWLKGNGLPAPVFRCAASAAEAAQACAEIGFPCVMKIVSPEILHKSEIGGVLVGITSPGAAQQAFQTIRQRAAGKDFRGVIIYPQVKGAHEVLLGLTVDPQFGPVVAFGLGGIYTEIWRDIALRVAPVSREEAARMIHSIKGIKLLEGARGSPPGDLVALADTLARFSELPFFYPQIAEVDLNPVFVFAQGLVIGDARVIKAG